MKNLFSLLLLSLLMVSTLSAQEKVKKNITTEFNVEGVCGMCENRIEKAALIKGVKIADWNKETQLMTVTYSSKKTTEEAIHQAIADAGHDTQLIKATKENYSKLPGCCAYRDGIETH